MRKYTAEDFAAAVDDRDTARMGTIIRSMVENRQTFDLTTATAALSPEELLRVIELAAPTSESAARVFRSVMHLRRLAGAIS